MAPKSKKVICFKTVIAVFVFIFASDWLIHGILLKDMYAETMMFWRPEAEMIMWAMLAAQAIMSLFFVIIFSYGYEGKGPIEGVRYGFLMGAFNSGPVLIQYAVSPFPPKLIGAWIGFGFLQFIIAGVIASVAFGKSKR